MSSLDILTTTVHPDGKVVVSASGTVVSYHRPAFGLMHIELSGREDAALTVLFFRVLEKELAFEQRRWPRSTSPPRLELFVDASRVSRHGLMFESWIRFLVQHRQRLHHIHIFADNPVSRLSVEIIRHLASAESLIVLYEDAESFCQCMQSVPANPVPKTRFLLETIRRLRTYIDDFKGTSLPNQWQK